MPRLRSFFAILFISGLIGSTPLAARANDQPATPRTAVGGPQLAERMIVCSRRGCRTLRAGCQFLAGPHPRFNRIVCNQARAT
jgi:hypothetical protein